MDTMERPEGRSIGVPKGRPTVCSCPWLWRKEVPSLHHLWGQGPCAAEAWAAGRGWEQSAGVKAHRRSQGGVADSNPDVDPNDVFTECACARLCVGAFHGILVNSLYYSYIHRNNIVARGSGREIQEGQDTCTPMANSC